MQVIEAQCLPVLAPHDHLHIKQMRIWLAEMGVSQAPVLPLAITDVVPDLVVAGPVPDLAEQVRDLHRRFRSA
jgi:hypothetical protein